LRRAFGTGGWDVEIVEKAGVVRDDDEEAGCFLESADDHGGAAFEDAKDAAAEAIGFGRTATAGGAGTAIDAGDDKIAVEGGAGVFGCDVEIGGSVGWNDEGEAFGVKLDGAGDEIGIACGDVVGVADAGDAALFFEGEKGAGDGGEGNAEAFGEGGGIEWGSFFALEEGKKAVG